MSLQTPRQRLQRSSYNTGSAEKSPAGLGLSASAAVNRKASLQALTGGQPRTPGSRAASAMAGGGDELDVGDSVNVPGDMYGTVKFIGSVRGKNGTFVGVELDRAFAAKGKNDGDVDGTYYFTTSIPGSGIFLPVHRAEKRSSPTTNASDSFPPTPNTPSHSTLNGNRARGNGRTPPIPAATSKFSQSVGPGARPSSPQFKPRRPSLPRPESPLRKQAPNLAPTPAKNLSQSVRGGRPNFGASTTTPNKPNFRATTTTSRPAAGATPRPYSRTGSRLGQRGRAGDDEDSTPVGGPTAARGSRTTSQSSVPSFSQPLRSPSRLGSAGGQDHEIQRLQKELNERDRRLEEQAETLAEMETSVRELTALMPGDGLTPGGTKRGGELGDDDEQTTSQLRQLLREKNEKIALMTSEFDGHRADFRSTLDSLEMASTETERVYEEQKRDLLSQVSELQQQNEQLQQEALEMGGSREDFEGVASQLKQLEELVAELEEGLEESRRGEAEARGEVEFLRGEVERGRSELAREREKGASLTKDGSAGSGSGHAKELEGKDDEIRGLKAIIHNLSSNPSEAAASTIGANGYAADDDELKRLQDALEQSQLDKESLEEELEQLRRESALSNGARQDVRHQRNESERTATAQGEGMSARQRSGTVKASQAFAERAQEGSLTEEEDADDNAGGFGQRGDDAESEATEGVYCEMCQSREHDTVECETFAASSSPINPTKPTSSASPPPPLNTSATGKENASSAGIEGGKDGKPAEEDKWCALCEKDGHLAFDCPEEQY
ncbi:hypothetical protein KC324_g965 [Hortaea werneckii]|nr:hypothetical protein KC324_g965 [Hortaea werneckii]